MLSPRYQLVALIASAVLFATSLTGGASLGTPVALESVTETVLAHARGANQQVQPDHDGMGNEMQQDCGDVNITPGLSVGHLRCGDRDALGNYIHNLDGCILCEDTNSTTKTNFDPNGQDPGWRNSGFPHSCGTQKSSLCDGLGRCPNPMVDPNIPNCNNPYDPTETQD